MTKELRELAEKLYYAPRMDDLNPTAWKDAHINKFISDIKQWAKSCVPEKFEMHYTGNDVEDILIDVKNEYKVGYNEARNQTLNNIEKG